MKHFFVTIAGVVVGFFLILIIPVMLIVAIGAGVGATKSIFGEDDPSQLVLRLDLRQGITDQPQNSIFQSTPSLLGIVGKLAAAENDDNVKGLFIRASSWGMGPVKAEQIRLAIKDFRDSGKFVIVHSQGFDDTSITSYLSVSAADEIWIQDTAAFAATGLSTETAFFGGVFEKINAKPEFEQFYEYKNSANTFTKKTFTAAHRESTLSWITDVFNTAIKQIAVDRNMNPQQLQAITDQAPFTSKQAVEAGLVDKLGHVVEAREAALARAGDGEILQLSDYAPPASKKKSSAIVALVSGEGAIATGSGGGNPFSSEAGIYSDQMSEAIIAATKNKKVKAILIRIDSPGGSAIASDQIWNAIERAKAKDKKIIISMGQLAASGGYYIAAGADAIIAYPTTITGSIGVLGGKVVLDDTYDMIGYNVEQLNVGGEFAGAYSSSTSFSDKQRAAFRAGMADIYEDFTGKVATGRDMPLEAVLEIAKGRVWTGVQAKENGLVDELGGFKTAIAKTKELLGLKADDRIILRRFPAQRSPMEELFEMFGISTEAASTMAKLQFLVESEQIQTLLKIQQIAEQKPAELQAEIPLVK
ncbi:MAG: signal peptide peptidase SppA [Robiginitomaculum sp.]|nr:signal peptide peptidase SppA [Robiginitomaculum sp.]